MTKRFDKVFKETYNEQVGDYQESLAVVKAIQEQLQLPLLETLQYIKGHTQEFSIAELRAFYKVMDGFQKMFA
jgi:hypothetical protein